MAHNKQLVIETQPQKHSTEFTSLNTPFGVRRKSFRKTEPAGFVKKPIQSGIVDSELQRHFAKRQLKNSDPNSLVVVEKKIHKTMVNTRASVKQNENEKYVKNQENEKYVKNQGPQLLIKHEEQKGKIFCYFILQTYVAMYLCLGMINLFYALYCSCVIKQQDVRI